MDERQIVLAWIHVDEKNFDIHLPRPPITKNIYLDISSKLKSKCHADTYLVAIFSQLGIVLRMTFNIYNFSVGINIPKSYYSGAAARARAM